MTAVFFSLPRVSGWDAEGGDAGAAGEEDDGEEAEIGGEVSGDKMIMEGGSAVNTQPVCPIVYISLGWR